MINPCINDYIVDNQTNTIWKINNIDSKNIPIAINKRYFKNKFTNLSLIKEVNFKRILFANIHRNINSNYWWGDKMQ